MKIIRCGMGALELVGIIEKGTDISIIFSGSSRFDVEKSVIEEVSFGHELLGNIPDLYQLVKMYILYERLGLISSDESSVTFKIKDKINLYPYSSAARGSISYAAILRAAHFYDSQFNDLVRSDSGKDCK